MLSQEEKLTISRPIRETKRAQPELVKGAVLRLCAAQFVTMRELADLFGRDLDSLREDYVKPLVDEGKLVLQYPDNKTHPQQGYRTADT